MFRRIKQAIDNLIAALDRWTVAVNRHADDLEATDTVTPATASNGQHAAETRPARARR
jgi:hypothetical protein